MGKSQGGKIARQGDEIARQGGVIIEMENNQVVLGSAVKQMEKAIGDLQTLSTCKKKPYSLVVEPTPNRSIFTPRCLPETTHKQHRQFTPRVLLVDGQQYELEKVHSHTPQEDTEEVKKKHPKIEEDVANTAGAKTSTKVKSNDISTAFLPHGVSGSLQEDLEGARKENPESMKD